MNKMKPYHYAYHILQTQLEDELNKEMQKSVEPEYEYYVPNLWEIKEGATIYIRGYWGDSSPVNLKNQQHVEWAYEQFLTVDISVNKRAYSVPDSLTMRKIKK
jgi:hypothetical protein